MPKPTDPEKHEYMFSDDMKFLQKVVIIHSQDNNKILILKRSADSFSRPNDWDLAGGNMLYGENHEESLRKEILEETALECMAIHPIKIITNYLEDKETYYLTITYAARAKSDKVTISHEHSEYRWITAEEANELLEQEYLKDAVNNNIVKNFDLLEQ